ncbi:MAG: response regulator [Verrucomicrobiales bacterium]|jgi:CheY-like chemotaxis protein|nr:response regulator [Verrucomicrobiales bacterium]
MVVPNKRSTVPVAPRNPRAQWLHDFNNVLAAIRLQAVLARIHADGLSPDVIEALEEIEKGCERATELLGKLPDGAVDVPAAGERGSSALTSGSGRLTANGRHGSILLMDDNESLQVSLFKILSGLGYEVAVASGGTDCVERLRELQADGKRVDVCILDLKVPGGMGGVETLARLREIDPQLKAVASTGFSEGDVIVNFQRYGFQAALNKPFRIQQLVDLLDQLIEAPAYTS